MTVEAIDPERQVRVVPFLYLSKPPGIRGGVPYQLSVDKNDEDKVNGVKIVQKTQHSEDSYQVFEFAKVTNSQEGNFGVFAINTEDLQHFAIW